MINTIASDLIQSLVTATKYIFPDTIVARAKNNLPEFDEPYITVRVLSNTPVGTPSVDTLLSTSNKQTTTVNYNALVQFSFTALDEDVSFDLATHFAHVMNSTSVREAFRANNLSKLTISSVRDVSYMRETIWTQYYNVDVLFAYASVTEETLVPITAVQIEDLVSGEVFTVPPDVVITP